MTPSARTADYACAIIVRDGKVLLGRRAHFRAAHPNCWDFIGGRMESGETRQQTLIRELGEEIAITPLNPTYIDTIRDIHADPNDPPSYHFYKVSKWEGGEPVINNHEHSHLEWFTFQQVCDLSNLALNEYRKLLSGVLGD